MLIFETLKATKSLVFFFQRYSLFQRKSFHKTQVFLNWPLLELFCFCLKRGSGKDIAGSRFPVWFLLILRRSAGHPLFIAAQHVPRCPWTTGRAYETNQDLCSEDFTILVHYLGKLRKTAAISPLSLYWSKQLSLGKAYFPEFLHSWDSFSG